MTKPIVKPTRSMPKIDQEQGDNIDEGEGQEEWLSDGGFTDDDTLTSQDPDVTSSQDEQPTLEQTAMPEPQQVEETVENISNQLQLEINIGEDGVAVIRRQAVRVADIKEDNSTSPLKASTTTEATVTQPPAVAKDSTASATSASEGTADDDEHSAEDPEKLLDQLETFLIRKTDGKVLETKATVQTTLNDLVKKTVDDEDVDDEQADKNVNDADDGNDTDDLLSVLDDSVSRRTTRSLAKLQKGDAPGTAKGKANVQPSKQVTKSAEKSTPGSSQGRTATRTSSVSNRKPSHDDEPLILSDEAVHMSIKTSSNKKPNQKSLQNRDKNTSKIAKNPLTSSKDDEDLVKEFASKNSQSPQQLSRAVVKVERVEVKKPVMALSNINFGDTYNTFIQKQSIANKSFDNIQNKSLKKDSPKVYKRKASTFKESKIDPFDRLLQSDVNEPIGQSPKIKRLTIDSTTKSPMAKNSLLETLESRPNFASNISPKVSKSSDGNTKILTILEKNSSLSIKSNSPGNKIQTITRKTVTEIPKSHSPKVQPPKAQTFKIATPKIQPTNLTPKTQTIIRRNANDSVSSVSTNIRPISPLGKKFLNQQKSIKSMGLNRNSIIKPGPTNSKTVGKNVLSKTKTKNDSDDDRMDSDRDDHDMSSMPEWPGSDDEEEEEKPSVPSGGPQRKQEGILKKDEPSQAKLADPDLDEESAEFDSEDMMDDSDFEDMSGSDADSMYEDTFAIDLRDERAAEYLPLLGEKAGEILEREKRSLLQKLTTIRQGLKSLQDNAKKNQTDVEMSKLKIMELNTLLRQP